MVVPSYCGMLQAFGITILLPLQSTETSSTAGWNHLPSQLVSLGLGCILVPHYVSGSERIDGVFFVLIGKHQVNGFLDVASRFTMLLC